MALVSPLVSPLQTPRRLPVDVMLDVFCLMAAAGTRGGGSPGRGGGVTGPDDAAHGVGRGGRRVILAEV